jgi:hypothetical protein
MPNVGQDNQRFRSTLSRSVPMSSRPECPGEPTLHAFAAGQLDAAAARAVRLHLDGYAACRVRLGEAGATGGLAEPTSDAALTPG